MQKAVFPIDALSRMSVHANSQVFGSEVNADIKAIIEYCWKTKASTDSLAAIEDFNNSGRFLDDSQMVAIEALAGSNRNAMKSMGGIAAQVMTMLDGVLKSHRNLQGRARSLVQVVFTYANPDSYQGMLFNTEHAVGAFRDDFDTIPGVPGRVPGRMARNEIRDGETAHPAEERPISLVAAE